MSKSFLYSDGNHPVNLNNSLLVLIEGRLETISRGISTKLDCNHL